LAIPNVAGTLLKKQLRAEWSIAIRMSRIFPVAVESQRMVLSDVDVRLAILRIVQREDFLIEIFKIDPLVRRNVLREHRSMKI
jgi:hypothetical protein